jgi:predicted O-methyltransferase YrrM
LRAARDAIGFMPEDEGLALYQLGRRAARVGPLLEIGSYCGKSAIYLGAAAQEAGTMLFSIDHHHGSEENQPGEVYHDPRLVDQKTGRIDTLPWFRGAIAGAGLEETVEAIVGRSADVAASWLTPLGMVFIDGGHTEAAAQADYECWSGFLGRGGILAIHDVFADPADGGQAPYHVYQRALESRRFTEVMAEGSLRGLVRAGDPG